MLVCVGDGSVSGGGDLLYSAIVEGCPKFCLRVFLRVIVSVYCCFDGERPRGGKTR